MAPQILATITPRVRQALADSPVFALRELTVENQNDSIIISGTVGSFYHKQLAQEVVRAVARGLPVVNSIEVQWEEED